MAMDTPATLPLNFWVLRNKVWNKYPGTISFLYHCIYLHKKSSAVVTFLMKQFWQPKWIRIFHLPLLADVATSEHHENFSSKCHPLVLLLPHLVLRLGWQSIRHHHDLDLPWLNLFHVKAFWGSSPIRMRARCIYQFKCQLELFEFAKTRVTFYTPAVSF